MNTWEEAFNRNDYKEGRKLLMEAVANRDPVALNDYICFSAVKKYGFDESPMELEAAYSALCLLTGHENYGAKEALAAYFFERENFAKVYEYANEAHTSNTATFMGALYENGDYVSKNRSKAYEYYSLALSKPDCSDNLKSVLKDAINRTYIGSSHHASDTGRYIVKRLTIAVVGTLLILGFFALFSAQ